MPDFTNILPMLVLLLAIGAFAGVVAGLLGVGGGIILVPAFYFAFSSLGYDSPQLMQICLATSLATIVFTSIRSVLSHNKKGAVDWDILKRWGPGIALGALVGMLATKGLRSTFLMGTFGFIGLGIGLYLAFGRSHWRLGARMPGGLARMVVSPLLGFLSVLMGIGGGSFGVPLMSLYSVPIHRAVATAAGFGVIIALPAVVGFMLTGTPPEGRPPMMLGQVNLAAFLVVISMTLMTAPLGVRLAHRMDPKPLKRVFAVFIMIMALNMLRKAFLG